MRWHAITAGSALYLHSYQACPACDGKGIVFATRDDAAPAWDGHRNRWVS